MFTYPPAPVRLTQGATAIEIHTALKSPNIIRRRMQELAAHRFIADYLLPGRYVAQGGSILFEEGGESIFATNPSEAVSPGGEFPLTSYTESRWAAAQTRKWGLDSEITDEAISRRLDQPVQKAFRKSANTLVRDVDSISLGVISSTIVTAGNAFASPREWDEAEAIIESVLLGIATREETLVGEAYDFSTVVLKPTQHAKVAAYFMTSGMLRDLGSDAVSSGVLPGILGLNWVTSTHVPFSDPFVVDRDQLGGMADENIESPGYSRTEDGVGIETKAIREDKTEKYLLRARRVTVPVVIDANAGFRITNTGL